MKQSSEWRENYGVSKTFPLELRKKSNFFGAYGEQGATTLTRRFSSGITYLTGNGIFAATNLIQYARIINQVFYFMIFIHYFAFIIIDYDHSSL